MISSGRFLSVTEMDAVLSFGDRYGRHSNMVKVLRLLDSIDGAMPTPQPIQP